MYRPLTISNTSTLPCLAPPSVDAPASRVLRRCPEDQPSERCESGNPTRHRQSDGKGSMTRLLERSACEQAAKSEACGDDSTLDDPIQQIDRPLAYRRLPSKVTIVEVGPRDGLQNEMKIIDPAIKIALIDMLSEAGFAKIEAASFVAPKWVPQMAASDAVMRNITRKPGVLYSALTPNRRGVDAAIAAKADEVVIFGSASESFSKKNINCSIAESFARFRPVADAARANGIKLRGSISCAFDCPTEGRTPVDSLVRLVRGMRDLGCDEIDIADTTGKATPDQVREVMLCASQAFPAEKLSGHFHDTYGNALDNIKASLEVGITIFHASVAGLGGCPYAEGATGNVATEDVLALMKEKHIETGIDMDKVVDAGQFISRHLGRRYVTPAGNAVLAMRQSISDNDTAPGSGRAAEITLRVSATLAPDTTTTE